MNTAQIILTAIYVISGLAAAVICGLIPYRPSRAWYFISGPLGLIQALRSLKQMRDQD